MAEPTQCLSIWFWFDFPALPEGKALWEGWRPLGAVMLSLGVSLSLVLVVSQALAGCAADRQIATRLAKAGGCEPALEPPSSEESVCVCSAGADPCQPSFMLVLRTGHPPAAAPHAPGWLFVEGCGWSQLCGHVRRARAEHMAGTGAELTAKGNPAPCFSFLSVTSVSLTFCTSRPAFLVKKRNKTMHR